MSIWEDYITQSIFPIIELEISAFRRLIYLRNSVFYTVIDDLCEIMV